MPQAIKRRDRLIGLFAAGAVLLNPPILTLFSGGSVFGWPALYVYLFGVWAALIACLALVLENRPESLHDPDEGGGVS